MFHNHSKGNLLNSAEPTQKLGNNSTTSFDMPSSGLPTHSIFRSSTPQMQQNVKSPLHESPSRKKRKQKNMNKIFGACIKALNLKIKREKKEDRELRMLQFIINRNQLRYGRHHAPNIQETNICQSKKGSSGRSYTKGSSQTTAVGRQQEFKVAY